MAYKFVEQLSPAWWELKVGKVSGTRFGQLISTRENMLVEELANEKLDGFIEQSDYMNEEMEYGLLNEEVAIKKYEQMTGLSFLRGGVLVSDEYSLLMSSPDAITADGRIVVEVKSTMSGAIQLRRFVKGVDTNYIPQIICYFATSPNVEQVRWISYCSFRPERPIVEHIFTRNTVLSVKKYKNKPDVVTTVQSEIKRGLERLPMVEAEVIKLIKSFHEVEF